MAEFTKGTWKFVSRSGRFRIFSNDRTIAETPRPILPLREEVEANARLIAAAPEMFELLKNFTQCKNNVEIGSLQLHVKQLLTRIDGKEVKHE